MSKMLRRLILGFIFIGSFATSQKLDQIVPYESVDTTAIYLFFSGDFEYEKHIQQSPPKLSLIFPNTSLSEGESREFIELPPLYKLDATEKWSNTYREHSQVDLYFREIPNHRIERIDGNTLRILWAARSMDVPYQLDKSGQNYDGPYQEEGRDHDLEIWSNFNNEVSINAKNADLRDILRLLAKQNNMNLVAAEGVAGTITLTLKNVGVGTALDAILKVNGYNWFIEENIIVIKPVEDDVIGGLVTRVYKLEHTDAFSIGTALSHVLSDKGEFQVFSPVSSTDYFGMAGGMQSGMSGAMQGGNMMGGQSNTSGGNSRTTGSQSGTTGAMGGMQGSMGGTQGGNMSMMSADYIVVTDVYSNFSTIDRIINELDIRVPQINIAVKFIETKLNAKEQLGIDWEIRAEAIGPVPDPNAELVDFGSFSLFDYNSISLYSLTIPVFKAILEMLSSDDQTRLLQEPQQTTKNNTTANMKIGTTYPVAVTRVSQLSETTSFEEKDISITLQVKPRINEEKYVSLDIMATVEALVGFSEDNSTIPIISDRTIKTHVRVEDGKTILIGGLIFDQSIEGKKKVPFLSSIPFLGKLFTHTTYTTEQRELLIFITPSIIQYH